MTVTTNTGAEHLFLKLQHFARLSDEDRAALDKGACDSVREMQARRDLIREGDDPKVVRLILSGWACRYKALPDGRRQILGFFIPGDLCDLNVYILKKMDHSIGAITRGKYAVIRPHDMIALTQDRPRIAQALWWHELVTVAIQREWLLNVGQRSAYEKIAHLLVELFVRLRAVNLTRDQSCNFPITQTDIAEATGLTSVHVNRMLQTLRSEGLVDLSHRRLTILDLAGLMRAALFNSDYLHLDHEGQHLDARS